MLFEIKFLNIFLFCIITFLLMVLVKGAIGDCLQNFFLLC